MHGGTLTATSEGENKGAVFALRLPLAGTTAARRDGREAAARVAKENSPT
jgi:hypothetical protein